MQRWKMIFKTDIKKHVEDAYARGYKKAEQALTQRHEIEKQKIIDDMTWENEKLKQDIEGYQSDVKFFKTQYEGMSKQHLQVKIIARRNAEITNKLFSYADEASKSGINVLQEFGMLKDQANNNLIEEKK